MTSKEYKEYLDNIEAKEKHREENRMKHKCNGCWCGSWTGSKYFCMMPKCVNK